MDDMIEAMLEEPFYKKDVSKLFPREFMCNFIFFFILKNNIVFKKIL